MYFLTQHLPGMKGVYIEGLLQMLVELSSAQLNKEEQITRFKHTLQIK